MRPNSNDLTLPLRVKAFWLMFACLGGSGLLRRAQCLIGHASCPDITWQSRRWNNSR